MKERIVDNSDYIIYLETQKKRIKKYRVFNKTTKKYEEKSLYNLQEGKIENDNDNLVVEQKTGYRDRFGKEIYEGDIVTYYQEITKTINEKELQFFEESYIPEGKKRATGRRKYCLFNGEKYYADYATEFKSKGVDENDNLLIVVYTGTYRARKAIVTADGWHFAQSGQYGWYRTDKEGKLYLCEIIGNIHLTPELYNRNYKTDIKGPKERLEFR